MMNVSKLHPCFSCSLPDCDDKSRSCELRRAIAKQGGGHKAANNRQLNDVNRLRYQLAYKELYAENRQGRKLRDVVREVGG